MLVLHSLIIAAALAAPTPGGASSPSEASVPPIEVVGQAAEGSNTDAMLLLGRMLEFGTGHRRNGEAVKPEPDAAAKWYARASQGGSSKGALFLAQLKLRKAEKASPAEATVLQREAAKWFGTAAEAGDLAAMLALGEASHDPTHPCGGISVMIPCRDGTTEA